MSLAFIILTVNELQHFLTYQLILNYNLNNNICLNLVHISALCYCNAIMMIAIILDYKLHSTIF